MPKAKYNWAHQRKRAVLLPLAIGRPCPFCGGIMAAWMKLDLDHTFDAIAHAACNRSHGARVGNALRGLRRRYSIYQGGRK
jgi:hypothetical protein